MNKKLININHINDKNTIQSIPSIKVNNDFTKDINQIKNKEVDSDSIIINSPEEEQDKEETFDDISNGVDYDWIQKIIDISKEFFTPFKSLDISTNTHNYLEIISNIKIFDIQLLNYWWMWLFPQVIAVNLFATVLPFGLLILTFFKINLRKNKNKIILTNPSNDVNKNEIAKNVWKCISFFEPIIRFSRQFHQSNFNWAIFSPALSAWIFLPLFNTSALNYILLSLKGYGIKNNVLDTLIVYSNLWFNSCMYWYLIYILAITVFVSITRYFLLFRYVLYQSLFTGVNWYKIEALDCDKNILPRTVTFMKEKEKECNEILNIIGEKNLQEIFKHPIHDFKGKANNLHDRISKLRTFNEDEGFKYLNHKKVGDQKYADIDSYYLYPVFIYSFAKAYQNSYLKKNTYTLSNFSLPSLSVIPYYLIKGTLVALYSHWKMILSNFVIFYKLHYDIGIGIGYSWALVLILDSIYYWTIKSYKLDWYTYSWFNFLTNINNGWIFIGLKDGWIDFWKNIEKINQETKSGFINNRYIISTKKSSKSEVDYNSSNKRKKIIFSMLVILITSIVISLIYFRLNKII